MKGERSRRQFLKTVGCTVGGSAAIGYDLTGRTSASQTGHTSIGDGDWPMPGRDRQGTRYVPEADGPTGDIEQTWTLDTTSEASGPVTISGDTVFSGGNDGRLRAIDADSGDVQWETVLNDAVDAPTVRGDVVYTGTMGGVLYAVSVDDGTIQWQADVGTWILCAPAVADGVVYTGDETVYALDAQTGEELWTVETPDWTKIRALEVVDETLCVGTRSNVFAVSTDEQSIQWTLAMGRSYGARVTVNAGSVYVCGDGDVYSLSISDGKIQWRTDVEGLRESTPVVVGDSVYLTSQYDGVYCLSTSDGSETWSRELEGEFFTAPAVADGTLYVGTDEGLFRALSTDNGDRQWQTEVSEGVLGSAVLGDGLAYIGSGSGYTMALSTDDGTERWRLDTSGRISHNVAVVDDVVYLVDGDESVRAIDATDRTQQWQYELTDSWFTSQPTVVDGTVYVGTSEATLLALSVEDGSERWEIEFDEHIETGPTVTEDTVYVGTDHGDYLYALDVTDGTIQWQYDLGSWPTTPPAVYDDTVYVGTWDCMVYALDVADGSRRWRFVADAYVTTDALAVTEETVYCGTDRVHALSRADGSEQWTAETEIVPDSISVSDERLYVTGREAASPGSDTRWSRVKALSRTTGERAWQFGFDDDTITSGVVVTDECVYLSTRSGRVYGLDVDDGTSMWQYDIGYNVETSPVLGVDTLYLGDEGGILHALTEPGSASGPDRSTLPGADGPATDLDGDTLLEDTNGDGSGDIFDALSYYNNRDSATVQNNPEQFDFDGDGDSGTLFDALELYNELR